MIILEKRRLLFWLIKAYIKRLGYRILIFFFVGLLGFFMMRLMAGSFISKVPVGKTESMGVVGAYTLDSLPAIVLKDIGTGLTSVSLDGTPKTGIASSWRIQDNGKTYVFNLKKNMFFSDGKMLTSDLINYNFSDTEVLRPNKYQIIFRLKDSYSPFLITVAKPFFEKGLTGVSKYKIKDLNLNGNFVVSLTLVSTTNQFDIKKYQFYPNTESLKTALLLGEITKAEGLSDTKVMHTSFNKFPNLSIKKSINYNRLIALFFNTKDSVLSDKKLRNSLAYAIPDDFDEGKRSYSLFPPTSWAYTDSYAKLQDLRHAKNLLEDSGEKTSNINLEIKTFSKYKDTAIKIQNSWKRIGIKSKVELVESVPESFQVFLGDFRLPDDPDQYTLWHSNQENNITNYKNLRIDKLLEDGRKTNDINSRKKIYYDLQKYLLDDSPAIFLYFQYEYEVSRK